MTMLLIGAVLLCFSLLFGAFAALLLVPADLIAEACRPGDLPPRQPLSPAGRRATAHEPTGSIGDRGRIVPPRRRFDTAYAAAIVREHPLTRLSVVRPRFAHASQIAPAVDASQTHDTTGEEEQRCIEHGISTD